MERRVKEFVDIRDHVSLNELIAKLHELRDTIPEDSDAELRLRGDDVFGRRITISYFRAQTEDEAELERRYSTAVIDAKRREFERLQAELGFAHTAPPKRSTLRIVA